MQAHLAWKWVPHIFWVVERKYDPQAGVLVGRNIWGSQDNDNINCALHQTSAWARISLCVNGKFSSDDVESLFSTIRQLNGSNDQTDAYAALSSLQKILVTGCIHSSPSGNVGSVIGSIGEATKLALEPASVATPEKDIKKLLLPHLTALERFPCVFPSFYYLTIYASPTRFLGMKGACF